MKYKDPLKQILASSLGLIGTVQRLICMFAMSFVERSNIVLRNWEAKFLDLEPTNCLSATLVNHRLAPPADTAEMYNGCASDGQPCRISLTRALLFHAR